MADWKCKVKSKASDLNKGLTQTGGGGPLPELNPNEKRLIAILGTTFITGTKGNKELGLVSFILSVCSLIPFVYVTNTF